MQLQLSSGFKVGLKDGGLGRAFRFLRRVLPAMLLGVCLQSFKPFAARWHHPQRTIFPSHRLHQWRYNLVG